MNHISQTIFPTLKSCDPVKQWHMIHTSTGIWYNTLFISPVFKVLNQSQTKYQENEQSLYPDREAKMFHLKKRRKLFASWLTTTSWRISWKPSSRLLRNRMTKARLIRDKFTMNKKKRGWSVYKTPQKLLKV